ncbi:MAG TPA: hypothetical protein VEK06_01705, partial [Myxococcota bacterium]|nr:hypothetical protein [Myxococcota bacterium]
STISANIILDFLDKVGKNAVTLGAPNGDAARAAEISVLDPTGKNALQLMLTSLRAKPATLLSYATVLLLASDADAAAIRAIDNDKDTIILLSAVDKKVLADLELKVLPKPGFPGDPNVLAFYNKVLVLPNVADLSKVALALDPARLGAFAEFSAEHSSPAIASAFNAAYAVQAALDKEMMRNRLIAKAFDLGIIESINQPLNIVINIIKDGFFTEAELLASDFNPFGAAGNSTLLFALIEHLKTTTLWGSVSPKNPVSAASIVKVIINVAQAMKMRDTLGNWQNYLQNPFLNMPGGTSIIDLVKSIPTTTAHPPIDDVQAKQWLQF